MPDSIFCPKPDCRQAVTGARCATSTTSDSATANASQSVEIILSKCGCKSTLGDDDFQDFIEVLDTLTKL